MALKTVFSCQNCGYQSAKWVGRCPECERWNSFVQEPAAGCDLPLTPRGIAELTDSCPPRKLSDVRTECPLRVATGIGELDRVLGSGIVEGSVILLGGEPGIGKSTLMLQVSAVMSRDRKILYVSGEESANQLKLRSERIDASFDKFYIVNETNASLIISYMKQLQPWAVIVDSVQTLYSPEFGQSAGTVTQIKESSALLTAAAKALGICVFFVGHITKEGVIAGPKLLEHIVDSVVYFEGQRESSLRVLRAIKNRFGATDEVGIFSMTDQGLKEIKEPSYIFTARRQSLVPGSCVMAALEGIRVILIEIQALVSPSNYGISRQKAMGFDPNRMSLLAAGLVKNIGINLINHDIFLNVVGGVRVDEPASDLAACVSICSSFKDKPARNDTVVAGEVGLCSEVRSVPQIRLRINEAKRMGFKRIVMPASDLNDAGVHKNMELIGVDNVQQALGEVFA
ncbi:MAG: DNA repair protein RadA [Candidatus Omnitrophota bacterium]